MTARTARPPHGEDIGTVLACPKCGRQMVRIAILATIAEGFRDWVHVDRQWCQGPAR